MSRVWAHLHLPRLLKAGEDDVISVKRPGEKIRYTNALSLVDVTFRVHERGRQACIEHGQRNVHAWLVGVPVPVEPIPESWGKAVYDPWKGPTFVDSETLLPVRYASRVVMLGKDVYYERSVTK